MYIDVRPHLSDKRCCIIDLCIKVDNQEYWNSTAFLSEYVLQLSVDEQLNVTKDVISTLAKKFVSRFDNISYDENEINVNEIIQQMKNIVESQK